MAKKHKKNIQELLKKKQLLQNIGQLNEPQPIGNTPAVVSKSPPITSAVPLTPAPGKSVSIETATTTGREIRWTVISLIFILALLGGVIILDRKTPFLSELGNWLYLKLQLKG